MLTLYEKSYDIACLPRSIVHLLSVIKLFRSVELLLYCLFYDETLLYLRWSNLLRRLAFKDGVGFTDSGSWYSGN